MAEPTAAGATTQDPGVTPPGSNDPAVEPSASTQPTTTATGGGGTPPMPTGMPMGTGGNPNPDVTSPVGGGGGAGANAPMGGSAGTPAGGAGGAPGDTGPCPASRLNPEDIVICDDFEGVAAGMPAEPSKWWERDEFQPGDPPVVTSDQAVSGSNSVTMIGNNSEVMLVNLEPLATLGIADNDFYVRVRMRLAQGTADVQGHADMIEAAEANGGGQYPQFGDGGEELRLGVSIGLVDLNIQPGTNCNGEKTQRTNGLVDMTGGDGFNFEAETWYCVETHYAGDPGDGMQDTFRLWVDGMPIETLTVTDYGGACTEDWMPDYSYVKIGAQNFSGAIEQVWYDDVAIGNQPIGCD